MRFFINSKNRAICWYSNAQVSKCKKTKYLSDYEFKNKNLTSKSDIIIFKILKMKLPFVIKIKNSTKFLNSLINFIS